MSSARKVVKQLLYLLENLGGSKERKPAIADIELIYDSKGIIVGYNVKIVAENGPALKLVSEDPD